MIDMTDTLAIVHAWPDGRPEPKIISWLVTRGLRIEDQIVISNVRYIPVAYNRAVRDIALPSRYNQFIFCDKDVVPGPETDFMLQAEHDIVGVTCPIENMASLADPSAFHCGMWRTSRRVLETVNPPWFMFGYSPDGCVIEQCVCEYFRQKALKAGFTVGRAGWADHPLK